MPLFDGKVAIVTGGSSGLGQAACYLYAREYVLGAYYPIDGGYLAR